MQKIIPFLWFEDKAEEAMNFYMGVFKDAKIVEKHHMDDPMSGKKGSLFTATFLLHGQEFSVLNGGPLPGFKFSPAISFMVNCETQPEIDHLWEKLSTGGQIQQCGWLTDQYGITWQIIPTILPRLLNDKDRTKADRAMQAMLGMKKLDIETLKKAHAG